MMNGKDQIGSILFLIFVCLSCSRDIDLDDYKKLNVEYNQDSTSVISVGYIDNNGRQGEWYFFDEAGYISKIYNYHNGELNGKITEYICCRKFLEYTAINGKVLNKITYFSPNGDISNITVIDSLGKGFDFSLFNGQIYELNVMLNKDSLSRLFSNPEIDASDQYPDLYGCCNGD